MIGRHDPGPQSPAADAIVVAAGASTRMGGPDKLAALVGGRPLLAWTLEAQGDAAGAQGLMEQVLDARRRALGEEHPDTLQAMGSIAGLLHRQGDLAEAGLRRGGIRGAAPRPGGRRGPRP